MELGCLTECSNGCGRVDEIEDPTVVSWHCFPSCDGTDNTMLGFSDDTTDTDSEVSSREAMMFDNFN